jgi:hypothetical protein
MGAQVSFCIVMGKLTVGEAPLLTTPMVARFKAIQLPLKPRAEPLKFQFIEMELVPPAV